MTSNLYYIDTFAAAYGEGVYDAQTYSGAAGTPTTPTNPGATPDPGSNTGTGSVADGGGSGNTAGGSVLENTGAGIWIPLVFSVVLVIAAVSLLKKPSKLAKSPSDSDKS